MANKGTFLSICCLWAFLFLTGSLYATPTACSKKLAIGFPNLGTPTAPDEPINPAHIDIAIFKKIMALSGCEYSLETLPWKRTLHAVKHGQLDGTFDVSKTPDRQKFGYFSKPYRQETTGIAMRLKDIPSFKPQRFSDIIDSKLRIGVDLGFWYGNSFQDAFKNNASFRNRVLQSSGTTIMRRWLLKDRVDLFFIDRNAALHTINLLGLENEIGLHPYVLNSDSLHIMLSKKTTKQTDIEILNEGIESLVKSDIYQKLLRVLHTQGDPKNRYSISQQDIDQQ